MSAREEQAWNDEALRSTSPRPRLRFWRYPRPGLVLGASQARLLPGLPAAGADADRVVRGSGGTAVLTGPWMLGLSLALPDDHPVARDGHLATFEWLGTRCADALRGLGLSSAVATPGRRDAQGLSWACFAGLAPWEVTVDARKLVGLAQRRRGRGVLVAAGVLLDVPDWGLLCRWMSRPEDEAAGLERATVSCRGLLGRPLQAATVAAAIRARLSSCDSIPDVGTD